MPTLTHLFVSAKADGADATLVRASNWNAAHDGLEWFSYTVTGGEGNLAALTITMPTTQANTSYYVFSAQSTFTNVLGMGVQASSKTTTQFVLTLSGEATAGDIFNFLIGKG